MTPMVPDPVAVHNERMKLVAGFFNAVGLGLIGVGVLAPMVGGSVGPADAGDRTIGGLLGDAAPAFLSGLSLWPVWLLMGLVLHATAHYLLGNLKKVAPA